MAIRRKVIFVSLAITCMGACLGIILVSSQSGDVPTSESLRSYSVFEPLVEEITQDFLGADGQKTSWRIRYEVGKPKPGLLITGGWFKSTPSAEWFPVIGEIRLSEVFVPYEDGLTQLYDIKSEGAYNILQHTRDDAGTNGCLLHAGFVVKELRDTGVLWKYYDKVRRGHALVLWCTIGSTNYNYILEFAFGCDGSINCRLGSTGTNLPHRETMGHVHIGCWRIDLNVGEKDHNSVAVVRHAKMKGGKNKESKEQIEFLENEGGIEWHPESYTRIRVESNAKNSHGNAISYELIPSYSGISRPASPRQDFMAYDYWVTPNSAGEIYYCSLPEFVKQNRIVRDTDVVIWCVTSSYHLPRDEDGIRSAQLNELGINGVALNFWSGFELRPRNLFDSSPLFP